MRILPVIDLLHGQVVRGIAGRRQEYRPIVSRLAADAQPATVARAFTQFGFDTVYVADLDAITAGTFNIAAWQAIAAEGLWIWLDAGIGDSRAGWRLAEALALAEVEVEWVVGLESLVSAEEFFAIGEMRNYRAPVFSLDLKAGVPLTPNPEWRTLAPLDLARLAASLDATKLIVLDLADVGTGGGTRTLDLCRQIRQELPHLELIAGGGVRGSGDLRALAAAGCDGALVASALHDGLLTREEIAAASG